MQKNIFSKTSKKSLSILLAFVMIFTSLGLIGSTSAQGAISVADAIANNTGTATVRGYIIGEAKSGTSYKFEAPFAGDTNFGLADSPDEKDPSKIIPVQLPKSPANLRQEYGLQTNPKVIGSRVDVTGELKTYFSVAGIKDTTSIVLVEGGDSSTTPVEPANPVEPEPIPEPDNISTIAQVKEGQQGQVFSVSATVISKENAWGGNGFYVQDETGGLYIYPGSKQNVQLGDQVVLTGTLGSYAGALQLTNVTYLTKKGTAETPEAVLISATEVSNKDVQDTLVKIENLTISGIVDAGYGTVEYEGTDDKGNVVNVRIDNRSGVDYNSFTAIYENGDLVNVIGIASVYNGTYQVKPFDQSHTEMVKEYEGAPIDSAETLKIGQIQSLSHESKYDGQVVRVENAVVTKTDGNKGFYMQDINPDDNKNTSDAIYVFQGSNNLSVKVGDLVNVTGVVDEYGATSDLPTTQISNRPTVEVIGTAELPAPIILVDSSLPKDNIASQNLSEYDPDKYALDYWESIESMLVAVEDAVIIGPQTYGNLYVLPKYHSETLNAFGGYRLQENQNPNVIPIYHNDRDIVAKAGDSLDGMVVGVVGYDYGQPKILASVSQDQIIASEIKEDVTPIVPHDDKLTVASYNIENFSAKASGSDSTSDEKVRRIADSIINDLKTPDIIVLVELQDNDGQDDTGTVEADKSAQRLIDKVVELGGIEYTFAEIAPTNNTSGGAPGGNIRQAFLYNSERVSLKEKEVIGKDLPEFDGTRKSLAGYFDFKGNEVLVIGNHFNSKGGDASMFGSVQPPVLGSVPERLALAKKVNEYVVNKLAENSKLNVIVTGDMNDFEFTEALKTLEGDVLTNLVPLHPAEDRFSYYYNGNSQTLDHMLVNNDIIDNVVFDMVHVNSMFMEEHGRASDHDPVMLQLSFEEDTVLEEGNVEGNETIEEDLSEMKDPETNVAQGGANNSSSSGSNNSSSSESNNPKTADAGVAAFALTALLASGAFVTLRKKDE